jgi:hypothetical protein
MKISCLSALFRLWFKKPHILRFLSNKLSNYNFFTSLVIINLRLDPDQDGIRIQQNTRIALSELNTDTKHWLMWVTKYASPFLATDEDGLKKAEDPRLNVNSSKF